MPIVSNRLFRALKPRQCRLPRDWPACMFMVRHIIATFAGKGQDQIPGRTHLFNSITRDERLSDKVTRELGQAIEGGRFKPGDRLPSERELGDQFQVSRTVIREAVRSLAATGHVTVTAGRGVEATYDSKAVAARSMRLIVKDFGELEYSAVHEIRVPIEVQAAGLAALRASDEAIGRLRDICDEHERCIAAGDLQSAGAADLEFHDQLARLAGNPLLLAMYQTLAEVLKEVRTPALHSAEVAESGLRAHRWLLECIAARDPAAARGAMERHLSEAERIWRGEPPAAIA